jgi:phage shock protein PspC (stress-responsive transcriptional regulator)
MNGTQETPRRLVRHSSAGKIAGVCAGLADYLDTDVALVRLLWVILSIVPGYFIGGVVAYVAAWIVMPDSSGPVAQVAPADRRLTRSLADRKIAGVCGGIAAYLGIDSTVVRVAWAVLSVVPGAIIMGVIAYLAAWFIMPEETHATTHVVSPAA